MQHDLTSIQAFLDSAAAASSSGQSGHGTFNMATGNDPLVVQPDDVDSQGLSFTDLFRDYLASDVAKLPPTPSAKLPPTPSANNNDLFASLAPFSSAASGSGITSPSSNSTFDPATFMPSHMPGSPFSPESDDHSTSNGRSPVSLAELDFSTAPVLSGSADDFAIDPSVFDPPATSLGFDSDALFSLPELAPLPVATSIAASAPSALSVSPTVLPPLPALPVQPVASTSAVAAMPVSRPKRSVKHSVIREATEEAEQDECLYSSDASSVAPTNTTAASGTKRTTRTRRAPKKVRSESPSVAGTGDEDGPSARKLARTSVVPLASSTLHRTAANEHLPPVPMWADKPDPKEYAKLSSKEKRQMRNKISARNFRHRRKEYITTLEEEISTRDTLISELQDEVGVIRAENTGLKTEVATLREQWQNLLDKLSNMTTPPAPSAAGTAVAGLGTNPSRAVAAAATAAVAAPAAQSVKQEEGTEAIMPEAAPARRIGTRSTSGIQVPNLSKDVAPRRGPTGNWGAFGFGASNSFMSVHTTLVPDVNLVNLADGLHGKPSLATASPFSGQSFNPALNALSQHQLAELPSMTAHLRGANSSDNRNGNASMPNATFEDFFASANSYVLRPDALDQNRAALYGKLANNAAGLLTAQKQAGETPGEAMPQQQQPQQGGAADKAYLPIPSGFRPAFFRSPKASTSSSSTASELLAFQSPSAAAAAAAAAVSPVPITSHQDALEVRERATMAHVAQLANQTLVQRMASSFWDAFVGPSPAGGPSSGAAKSLDSDKVKAVLTGKARLQVVPVDAAVSPSSRAAPLPAVSAKSGGSGLDALERQMGALSVGVSAGSRSESPERCSFADVGRRWVMGEKRA